MTGNEIRVYNSKIESLLRNGGILAYEEYFYNLRGKMTETPEVDRVVFVDDSSEGRLTPENIFDNWTALLTLREDFPDNNDLYQKWASMPENQDGDGKFVLPSVESYQDYTGLRDGVPTKDAHPFFRFMISGQPEEYDLASGTKYDTNSDEYKKRVKLSERFLEQRRRNSTPDGQFSHNVMQGETDDCHFLAGLLALGQTEGGREVLDEILDVEEDGSITINFRGSGEQCTVKPDELPEEVGGKLLSIGDIDYLAAEHCLNDNIVKNKNNPLASLETQIKLTESPENPIDAGGFISDPSLLRLIGQQVEMKGISPKSKALALLIKLTGDPELKSLRDEILVMPGLDELSKMFESGEVIGATAGYLAPGSDDTVRHHPKLFSNHLYAIQNIDTQNRTVTVLDPNNPSKPIVLTEDEYKAAFSNVGLIKNEEYSQSAALAALNSQGIGLESLMNILKQ